VYRCHIRRTHGPTLGGEYRPGQGLPQGAARSGWRLRREQARVPISA
jgi:hypothetical protein